jgi:regulator of cell morphogenesis and NO signaling
MMTLRSEIPIGQLVTERPSRARLFERLGIDYCCDGRAPLGQACTEKGLDVEEVLRSIASADLEETQEDAFDAAGATMGALADHIVAVHHGYLRRELPRLAGLLEKVVGAHGERHPELRAVQEIFTSLKEELEEHIVKEEMVLFPIVKQLEKATSLPGFHCGSVGNPIHVMEHEHRDAGTCLTRLRELTGGYKVPPDSCNTYRALLDGLAHLEGDLHRHIHKENEILFPRALAAEAALLEGAN